MTIPAATGTEPPATATSNSMSGWMAVPRVPVTALPGRCLFQIPEGTPIPPPPQTETNQSKTPCLTPQPRVSVAAAPSTLPAAYSRTWIHRSVDLQTRIWLPVARAGMNRLLTGASSRNGGKDTPGAVVASSLIQSYSSWSSMYLGTCTFDIRVGSGDGNWKTWKRKTRNIGVRCFSCFSLVLLWALMNVMSISYFISFIEGSLVFFSVLASLTYHSSNVWHCPYNCNQQLLSLYMQK
jgi:hypothetical protein